MIWQGKKSWFLMGAVLVVLLCLPDTGYPQKSSASLARNQLKQAEKNYSSQNYAEAEKILNQLSESYPQDPQFSYFQLLIAQCEYHQKNYDSARKKFKDLIRQFPLSLYIPTCYFMLGNVDYLQGKIFESAQNFVQAYQLAPSGQLKNLSQKSLEPLLKEWLSGKELEKLSQTEKDKKLVPLIFFWLGKRNVESKNYDQAKEALSYYRDNFPKGEDIQEVNRLLKEVSSTSLPVIKVGVLASSSDDLSGQGTGFLKGIQLALSSYTPTEKSVELVAKEPGSDLTQVGVMCQELIEEDQVVCILGPTESESVVKATDATEKAQIPLLTPAPSKTGFTSLGNFVFELSPSEARKGRSMAEFAVRGQNLSDFIMLLPEAGKKDTEALNFKQAVEQLGGQVLAVEYYPPGTTDFSPYIEKLKKTVLGITLSSPSEETGSFFDQMPARVDGFFFSADQTSWYSVFSSLSTSKIYTTVISMDWRKDQQFAGLAGSLNQKLLFTTDEFPPSGESESDIDRPDSEKFLKSYKDQKEPDRFLLWGYDSMKLLLSIFDEAATPEKIAAALASTTNFNGITGKISFDPERENTYIPIYKLENGEIKKIR
jgi:branched-chain amino acid transport system substrate-binding protein